VLPTLISVSPGHKLVPGKFSHTNLAAVIVCDESHPVPLSGPASAMINMASADRTFVTHFSLRSGVSVRVTRECILKHLRKL